MRLEISANIMANAFRVYTLELKADAQYWRKAREDEHTDASLVESCKINEQEALCKLQELSELIDKLHDKENTCLADYVFYAEKI